MAGRPRTQRLYQLVVEAVIDGIPADRVERSIGFRTVVLDTSTESDGSRFAFLVNGERVWVRGFNWIPDDCFPPRVDRERYERRITDALDANANLLRVWGGGIYESDDFYEVCDRSGMLVWQDFLFACAAYPGELAVEVEAEARDAIDRLMSASEPDHLERQRSKPLGLVGLGMAVRGRRPGMGTALLPPDPSRSGHRPRSGPSLYRREPDLAACRNPPQQPEPRTDPHMGRVERAGLHALPDPRPRFVAEFGSGAGKPRNLGPGDFEQTLSPGDATMSHHQKAIDGMAKLDRALHAHSGKPAGFGPWLYLTQLIQAEALRTGVGHFRSLHDRCSGVIWWQLNDCWPALSWAVVDSDGRRKLAWYAARKAFADRNLIISPAGSDGGPVCFAVNDTRESWLGTAATRLVGLDGVVRAGTDVAFEVPADTATQIVLPGPRSPGQGRRAARC